MTFASARPPIQAVVFDLDGVLVDSEATWEAARREVVATFGGRYVERATRDIMGMSAPEWSQYLRVELGVPLDAADVEREVVSRVAAAFRSHLPLMPGARRTVRALGAAFRLAVASSSNRSLIELALELAGLRDAFAVVVSSEEAGRGKPAPDVYLRAAALLDIDPAACAAVEDSTNGIRSAHAAGMRTIAVPNRAYPPEPVALALAEIVLSELTALTPAVVAANA